MFFNLIKDVAFISERVALIILKWKWETEREIFWK